MTTLYHGSFLHALTPHRLEYVPRGVLEVDAEGRFRRLSRGTGSPAAHRGNHGVDLEGRLVIPGLIDAHLHFPQIDIIGVESGDLLSWLEQHVYPAEAECEDPEVARDRARRTFSGLLARGTTACGVFSSSHTAATEVAFEEAARAGNRAVIGKVLMDRGAPDSLVENAADALEATRKLIQRWSGRAGGRLEVAISPRFALTCSEELLAGAGRLARETGRPVHTHLAESPGEVAEVARLFPAARDYTDIYRRADLLNRRSLLAHCVHLSVDELERLGAAGSTAVHCPDANFYLHSGRFPFDEARRQRVPMALGSDIGAGTTPSMFTVMKMASYTQEQPLDPELLFYLATLGGARALGWENRIGNFAAGKQADLVVLDLDALPGGGKLPADASGIRELLSRMIHASEQIRVEQVRIAGRRVV